MNEREVRDWGETEGGRESEGRKRERMKGGRERMKWGGGGDREIGLVGSEKRRKKAVKKESKLQIAYSYLQKRLNCI